MTEREKMLAGLSYDTRDEELLGMYHRAKLLLCEYDHTVSTDIEKKTKIMKDLLGYAGEDLWIEKGFCCDYGKNIFIGKNSFINYNCVFVDDNYIKIGDCALIGPAVQIYTAEHPIPVSKRIVTKESGQIGYLTHTKPVIIGKNCWIGGGSIICPGVTIGDDVVIGAGSVVTKDIPHQVVAYGVPCKVVSEISEEK